MSMAFKNSLLTSHSQNSFHFTAYDGGNLNPWLLYCYILSFHTASNSVISEASWELFWGVGGTRTGAHLYPFQASSNIGCCWLYLVS